MRRLQPGHGARPEAGGRGTMPPPSRFLTWDRRDDGPVTAYDEDWFRGRPQRPFEPVPRALFGA